MNTSADRYEWSGVEWSDVGEVKWSVMNWSGWSEEKISGLLNSMFNFSFSCCIVVVVCISLYLL
jgi:hypothetical protein